MIYALFHVAWVLRYGFGCIEEATPKLEEAKRRADATGSERLIWPALINLADGALDAGDWFKAASLASEALASKWELERPVGDMAFLLEIAAFAAAGGGAEAEARSLYSAAAQARRRHGWDPSLVRVVRERTDRLMAPVRSNVSAHPPSGSGEEQTITVDEAVALAMSLPARLSS